MPTLLVARLVVLEAIRRRLAVAAAGMTVAGIALSGCGFNRLSAQFGADSLQVAGAVSGIVIFMTFMFVTVLALASALIGATALGTELDNGTLLSILPRPLHRYELLAGKWLGAFGVVFIYGAASIGLESFVIWLTTGYVAPHPLEAAFYVFAVAAVMVTVAMTLSIRVAPLTSAIVAVVLYGAAWIDGIAHLIATALKNDGVSQGTLAASLLFPTDGLWRGALHGLEPAAMLAAGLNGPGSAGPFAVLGPPTPAFLALCATWFALVIWAGTRSFQTRDV
jgi:ABC-type transport system involved in multi-copper enzyme maturation permease subunit